MQSKTKEERIKTDVNFFQNKIKVPTTSSTQEKMDEAQRTSQAGRGCDGVTSVEEAVALVDKPEGHLEQLCEVVKPQRIVLGIAHVKQPHDGATAGPGVRVDGLARTSTGSGCGRCR